MKCAVTSNPNNFIYSLIERNIDLKPEILEQLIIYRRHEVTIYGDYKIHQLISNHPSASWRLLDWLLEYIDKNYTGENYKKIALSIAQHRKTSSSSLEKLVLFGEPDIRRQALQGNHNSYSKVIRFIKGQSKPHHSFFDEIMSISTSFRDYYILELVAKYFDTPKEILIRLAEHPHKTIRLYVAANTNTPSSSVCKLVEDEDERVRQAAASKIKNSEIIIQLAQNEDLCIRQGIAANHCTRGNTLEQLANDSKEQVRIEVAKNLITPFDILNKLAKDKVWEVRREVARNLQTPYDLLNKLAKDSNKKVRKAANRSMNK